MLVNQFTDALVDGVRYGLLRWPLPCCAANNHQ
jgi:hypothetical protein